MLMPISPAALSDGLASLPMLAVLPPESLAKLAKGAHYRTVTKGDVLYKRDAKADTGFILMNGWVKVSRATLAGDEAVLDVLTSGHMLGEEGLFNGAVYHATATVVESGTVLSFSLPELRTLMAHHQGLALTMLEHAAKQRYLQAMELENRALKTAPERLACFLLRLLPMPAKGAHRVLLPIDKILLAARLGMQPETLSRALKALQTDGLISMEGASISVPSGESLQHFSCANCSSAYPCQDLKLGW